MRIPLLALLLLSSAAFANAQPDGPALTAATHDLCSRQIVMLGESGTHGDGHTEAFKVALVERLVNQCGFDQVLFESSHYEFLHLTQLLRAGQPVAPEQLSAAVGGLWKFDHEFQPLVPFLLARAQAGKLSLGGIDDQLSGLGQDYANITLVTELTSLLPSPERQPCSLALHRRIFYDYIDAATGIPADQRRIADCLTDARGALSVQAATQTNAEQLEMVASIQHWNSRGYPPSAAFGAERDRSMFQNFEWLMRQPPQRHKTIVWAATVHIANHGASPQDGHATDDFGAYVHKEYGAKVFSLGFGALSGSYREARNTIHLMPAAPSDSIESQALRGTRADAVYLGPSRLASLGTVPGALFQHTYQTLPWSDFLDGVIIFREEHPPTSDR